MKVAELTDVLLDLWVAKAGGATIIQQPEEADERTLRDNTAWLTDDAWIGDDPQQESKKVIRWGPRSYGAFEPSRDWRDGGPIIEQNEIGLIRHYSGEWQSGMPKWPRSRYMSGTTPLVAAMRAYVASRYGDEVPDAA